MREKNISIYREIVEALTIFIQAVRKAQKENTELGLPNIYYENGRIIYQLPDGTITTKTPEILKRQKKGKGS
ncbi:MAG: hypothetical protein J7L26_09585 [Candidatus Aminicenantes bacterium]|nr:hypothetical protein [Candidatus Aminicenantes bacterium]